MIPKFFCIFSGSFSSSYALHRLNLEKNLSDSNRSNRASDIYFSYRTRLVLSLELYRISDLVTGELAIG